MSPISAELSGRFFTTCHLGRYICVCIYTHTHTHILEKPNQMKGNIWSSYFEIGKHTKVMLHRKRKKLTLMKICLHNNSLYYFYNLSVSIQFSCSVMSNSLQPHGLQHARFPCPSPTPRICSDSCALIQWCHPTISYSVVPFSSHLQSFPASGSFQMSQFFTSGGQSIGVSASASVLPMNTQDWFPSEWTGWISLQSKGLSRVFSNTTVQKHQFFGAQLSYNPTLSNCQMYITVLLTIVPCLCSSELIHLVTESLPPLINISPLLPPQPLAATILFCEFIIFLEFTVKWHDTAFPFCDQSEAGSLWG